MRPVVLCILDGWGWRTERADNAVLLAEPKNFFHLWHHYPHGFLHTSGNNVGLPEGQMGNSEVGHMNLGAGRIVYQDLPLIDRAISLGTLASNPALLHFIEQLKASGGSAHLMGLTSSGGVHAHAQHMLALAEILAAHKITVYWHAFLDGRDTPPKVSATSLPELQAKFAHNPFIKLASLCGRYYAMDRDQRWERTQKCYELLCHGTGAAFNSAASAIEASYAQDITDEFVLPVRLPDFAAIKNGDGVLFANFRADRARQILSALLDPNFTGFKRTPPKLAAALGMVEYSQSHNAWMPALFPPKDLHETLGEVVAQAGLKQLRIAETEKYPHVTFFFNGGREAVFTGEDRIMVPSPKVATYDLQPEMSAQALTDAVVNAINSQQYGLIILNYANPDMVGHTGSLEAAIKAVATVDECLGRVVQAVQQQQGAIFITADHGNCELMRDPQTGGAHTAHTLNPVPAIIVGAAQATSHLAEGVLADVAPTLLALMGLPQPASMSGQNLLRTTPE